MLRSFSKGKGGRKRKAFTRLLTALITWWFLWKRTHGTDDKPFPPTLEQVLDGCVHYATAPARWGAALLEDIEEWTPRQVQMAHGFMALATLGIAFIVGETGRKRRERLDRERKPPRPRRPKPKPATPATPGDGWVAPRSNLPDEATLRRNLQQYGANLARAMALKREHGDLSADQERLLAGKFDELRETVRMTEEILAHVVSVRERAEAARAEAARRAAEQHPDGCPCCIVSGG